MFQREKKKQIELPNEVKELCKNISSTENLTKVGFEYLAETTEYLKKSNLYQDADKEILVQYALSVQNFYKYLYLSNQNECIFKSDTGAITLHPFFKVMQHHEKQMLNYMDRLGLNPLARQKLNIEAEKELTEMEKFLLDIE